MYVYVCVCAHVCIMCMCVGMCAHIYECIIILVYVCTCNFITTFCGKYSLSKFITIHLSGYYLSDSKKVTQLEIILSVVMKNVILYKSEVIISADQRSLFRYNIIIVVITLARLVIRISLLCNSYTQ